MLGRMRRFALEQIRDLGSIKTLGGSVFGMDDDEAVPRYRSQMVEMATDLGSLVVTWADCTLRHFCSMPRLDVRADVTRLSTSAKIVRVKLCHK